MSNTKLQVTARIKEVAAQEIEVCYGDETIGSMPIPAESADLVRRALNWIFADSRYPHIKVYNNDITVIITAGDSAVGTSLEIQFDGEKDANDAARVLRATLDKIRSNL